MTYTITTSHKDAVLPEFVAHEPTPHHRPSWTIGGEGYAILRIQSHIDRPYLSIRAVEGYVCDGQRVSNKEVYITLNEHEGRKLYEWMKDRYEK